jgi:MFS family permease
VIPEGEPELPPTSRQLDEPATQTRHLDPAVITRRLDTWQGPLGAAGQVAEDHVPVEEAAQGFRALLSNGAFLRLWLAQISSQTAQNVIWWALFNQTASVTGKSPLGIGLTILMVQLPTIIFAGLSGVLVDRFSKRSILIISNAVRALGCFGYILFHSNYAALLGITFFVSVINQPFQPAETATIPLLVSERQLMSANALFQITFMVSQVVGFALGVPLVGLIGTVSTFWVGMGFLIFAAVVLIPLPPSTRVGRAVVNESASQAVLLMLREMAEVARVVTKDAQLTIALIQLSLAPAVLLILAQLGPRYVQQLLGTNQTNAMILLIAPAGVGIAIGLVLIDRFGEHMPKRTVAWMAMVAMGLAVIALAWVPNLTDFLYSNLHVSRTVVASLLTVPISLVLGLATALLNAPAQTIVQQRADAALRGRVLAVQQALAAAVTIPPLLLVGLVGQLLNVSTTLLIIGIILLLAGAASARVDRYHTSRSSQPG